MAVQKQWIKIETLTPLHIGSGKQLAENAEFLFFGKGNKIAVVDDEKVFEIIGRDRESIARWVSIINSGRDGELVEYLYQRMPRLLPTDVACRVMAVCVHELQSYNNTTLREQIHTNQRPLLPGSSIKGALYTALFANQLAKRIQQDSGFLKTREDLYFNKNKFRDTKLVKELMGKDSLQSMMRLIHISDVEFEDTACFVTDILNQKSNTEFEIKYQINLEGIAAGNIGVGLFQIPELHQKPFSQAQQRMKEKIIEQFPTVKNWDNFNFLHWFNVINEHIGKVLEKEINHWKKSNLHLPESATGYPKEVENLLHEVRNCTAKQCILRIGFGSGFRAITGDWQEGLLPAKWKELRTNKSRGSYPDSFLFPKTRKVVLGDKPMGFVKITMIEKSEFDRINHEKNERRKQQEDQQRQRSIFVKQQRQQQEAELRRQAEEAQQKAQAEQERKKQELELRFAEGKFKNGEKLEAIVIRNENKALICRLLVDKTNKEYKIPYASGMPVNTLIEVSIEVNKAGNKKVIDHLKFLKPLLSGN